MQDRLPDRKLQANGPQAATSTPERRPLLSKAGLGIVGFLVVAALITAGYAYWQHQTFFPTTDNAQLQANIIQIAPLVTGVVTDVKVEEYSAVKEGDVLVEINPAQFQAELKQAEGRIAAAQQQAQGAGAQAAAAKANVDQAQTAVFEARANLDHATIKAPIDGTVGKVRVRPGEIAKAGMGLFPLIDTSKWWVDANFKETDLSRIKPGQNATVTLDLYPSHVLTGKVEAISRASSSAFSLMPSENATGSWVKVVQRFPVRIALTLKADDPAMRVGASASVTIDTTTDGATSGAK